MYCIKNNNNMNIINVNVYRNGDRDCTNNGLSSKADDLPLVVLEFGESSADAIQKLKDEGKDPNRYLLLVRRVLWNEPADYIKPLTENRWVMMGGNFAYTCDGRFRDLTGSRCPLPIHDRVETAEQMRILGD